MPQKQINWPETTAALALAGFGAFMVIKGLDYPFGSLRRMGAGFMPVMLGGALIVLGGALIVETLHNADRTFEIRLRAVLSIIAALLFFAIAARPLGLIPAALATILLAALADPPFRPVRAGLTGLVVGVFCYVVFVKGLGISLRPFWW